MTFRHIKRHFKEPKESFYLFGPRGTGKSTLVQRRFSDALYIDLLNSSSRRRFFTHPELLLEVVRAQPKDKVIIIDEIQRVPELLSNIHILMEENQGWQFILTGSSARKLKKTGVDLLGGRALKKCLHPFMASELVEDFDLEESLLYGLLPLRFGRADALDVLSSYVSVYLDEEVKAEGIVRHVEPFARFLEVMSFSHGSVLNINNIARECHLKRPTVDSWMSIIEDLMIGFQIPVFTKRAKRLLTSHPKFYFSDAGIYRALRPRSVIDRISEIDGAALEGLVAQHLRAWIDYTKDPHYLSFWRTKSGVEIDFVLHGPIGFWAIEVKNASTIHPQDLRSLTNFLEDYPEAKAIFLYRGKERLLKRNIMCIPCDDFLLTLQPNNEILP